MRQTSPQRGGDPIKSKNGGQRPPLRKTNARGADLLLLGGELGALFPPLQIGGAAFAFDVLVQLLAHGDFSESSKDLRRGAFESSVALPRRKGSARGGGVKLRCWWSIIILLLGAAGWAAGSNALTAKEKAYGRSLFLTVKPPAAGAGSSLANPVTAAGGRGALVLRGKRAIWSRLQHSATTSRAWNGKSPKRAAVEGSTVPARGSPRPHRVAGPRRPRQLPQSQASSAERVSPPRIFSPSLRQR